MNLGDKGRWLPVAAALAVIAAAGAANGVWNDRWRVSQELREMTERLPQVPLTIGEWEGQEDTKTDLSARLIRQGTLHALVTRTYHNKSTGAVVKLLMATGRSGPISTHSPLTCVGNGDGLLAGSKVRRTLLKAGGTSAVFSHCDFRSEDPLRNSVTVFWSWHDPKRGWVAVDDARVAFASQRALTKIYVTQSLGGSPLDPAAAEGERELDNEPAVAFLRECLPTIDRTLFSQKSP